MLFSAANRGWEKSAEEAEGKAAKIVEPYFSVYPIMHK